MMGHQSRQMAMLFVDIESLIPETHLLRKIERMVSFDFIYDLLAPYYPATGRPSVDPVSMFKMLLVGYLYGVMGHTKRNWGTLKEAVLSAIKRYLNRNNWTQNRISMHSGPPHS